MPATPDITRQRFGRLVVRKMVGTARGKSWWDCVCDCGKEVFLPTSYLTSGNSHSCGCGQRAAAAQVCKNRGVHFMRGTRLYTIWRGMNQRCRDKNSSNYRHYGGRGISVCQGWLDFKCFMGWALSTGYSDNLSLDRIDVDGDYKPSNCRWATKKEQCINRRTSRFITFRGEALTVTDWARKIGIRQTTLANRFRSGWPTETALMLQVNPRNRVARGN